MHQYHMLVLVVPVCQDGRDQTAELMFGARAAEELV